MISTEPFSQKMFILRYLNSFLSLNHFRLFGKKLSNSNETFLLFEKLLDGSETRISYAKSSNKQTRLHVL